MSEFSHENLDFWLAVQEFKKVNNPQEMSIKAKMVYKHFIASNATNQVIKHEHSISNMIISKMVL